jgi:hypothetical protein
MKDRGFLTVRKRIESALETADQERKRKLLLLRLDLARSGMAAYERGDITTAVRSYLGYLKLLEEAKNVPEGGLMPSHFNLKTDLPELMTVSGIYWDLAKIYDHARTAEKGRDFLHYLEKYVIFSKGFTYQPLCAESLRKYISNRKPVHKKEFKNAYETLNLEKCFIVSSLADVADPETLPILRDFRNQVLLRYTLGQWAVAVYYRIGPALAKTINLLPKFLRQTIARLMDQIAFQIARK